MSEATEKMFRKALAEAGIAGDSPAADQFQLYLRLLEKWNARINLTASMEWRSLAPLFLEAIWASRFLPDTPINHLDIGSGAGFPAIPLRILRPNMRLCLVESRLKRVAFLEAAARELNLQGTRVEQRRLDDFLKAGLDNTGWNSVSWKALKLSRGEAAELVRGSAPEARFYLFHGEQLPLEGPEEWTNLTVLESIHRCPHHQGWNLSIYRPSRA
jgi:16S rRNA (guanine(527)-N(7))-methyltransferase RsmG